MVDRIVRRFDPLTIILFGSQARGDAGPHSDVDLLVVLPDNADTRQVSREIERELRDLPGDRDITATTPAEIRRQGNLVGAVLRPALREGKVLYERAGSEHLYEATSVSEAEVLREVDLWLLYAAEDLATAELWIDRPEVQPRQVGFLAQQSAEKALKSAFIFLQIQYPFTHNLDDLRERLPAGWRLKTEHADLSELSKWAVEPRYPGGFAARSRDEVRSLVQRARALLAAILRDLEQHGYRRDRER